MNFKNKIIVISIISLFIVLLASACGIISIKLTLDANGGIFAGGSDTYIINTDGSSTVTVPDNPTKEGYSFVGWFWDKDVWEQPFTANSLLDAPIQSDMTVYAKWTINLCTITFNSNGGSDVIVITQDYNTVVSAPTVPIKEGFAFAGWYSDMGLTTMYTFSTMPDENITLYAKWLNETIGLKYTEVEGGYSVSKGTASSTTVIIPPIHNLLPVKQITARGFYGYTSLTSITIPNSVTSIGDRAFSSCTSLNSITISESITSIGISAFSGCTNLTSITVEASNINYESIDGVLFNKGATILLQYPVGKAGITYTIPDNVISIGDNSFNNCISLSSITIASSVTHIGTYAFYNCSSLTSITIPNSVTSIGDYTFYNCSSLISIIIPDSITNIGNGTFNSCNTLTNITIPDSVISIGSSVFSDCISLTNITIPDSVTSIGYNVFNGCISLTSVTIGSGVTIIDHWEFSDCISLITITVDANNITYESIDGVLFNKGASILLQYPVGKVEIEYTIPISVTSIGSYAFRNCSGLTSIIIPNSVTSIGNMAFYNCTSLTSIAIGSGVTNIGNGTFNSCTSLTSIIIPDSVISIGSSAFADCTSLTNITIPDSVTSIGYNVFNGCIGLTSITIGSGVTIIDHWAFSDCTSLIIITVEESNANYESIEGVLYSKDATILIFYPTGNIETEYTIPISVTIIGSYAFRNCSGLTSIIIPNSITSIGSYAFQNCTSLTSITIPDSVTSIGDCAFFNCTSLISITIPDNVTSIGNSAFSGCSSLNTITIGSGVTSIGNWAFSGCSSLNTITIGSGVTSIGNWAFHNCTTLTNITIPDSVTSIGNWAFQNCTTLTNITIPGSVTSIGYSVFNGCISLTSITIPDSVTIIGDLAFSGCTSLTNITVEENNINYESINGVLFNKGVTLLLQYPVGKVETEYTIPSCITSIGNSAFHSCTNLTSVIIPDSVTSIDNLAFYNCINLISVTLNRTNPPSLGIYVFNYYNGINDILTYDNYSFYMPSISIMPIILPLLLPNIKIYVPSGSVDAYKNTEGWSNYADKIYAIED